MKKKFKGAINFIFTFFIQTSRSIDQNLNFIGIKIETLPNRLSLNPINIPLKKITKALSIK